MMFLHFIFLLSRDPHGIATNWDKLVSSFLIVLAVFSNGVAIYSDAYSIFHKSKPV